MVRHSGSKQQYHADGLCGSRRTSRVLFFRFHHRNIQGRISTRAGPGRAEEKMSKFARRPSFFIEVVGQRDGFPHRTELKGFIACDVTGRIHESTGTTRTMVTIVRLREIQPFGFRAATGPAAAWSGHCRRRRRPDPCVIRFPTHRDAEQTSLRQSSCVLPS